jgi:hypothetical protein
MMYREGNNGVNVNVGSYVREECGIGENIRLRSCLNSSALAAAGSFGHI